MTTKTRTPPVRDKHILYEASVQSPEEDVDFMLDVFKQVRKRPLRTFREDFCGTAVLSCEYLRRDPENRAWGVDIHQPTLDWGRKHHVSRLKEQAERLTLLCEDVREARTPAVDAACALNFSYWTFKQRPELLGYFRKMRETLNDEGIFFVDVFGGQEAMGTEKEKRHISGMKTPGGTKIPAFTYTWDQDSFNAVNHHIVCHIHFKLNDGTRLKKAFTYDWRMWTLPELQDLMLEAGFRSTRVYLEGWDDQDDEPDGEFELCEEAENQAGWVGYVVGLV